MPERRDDGKPLNTEKSIRYGKSRWGERAHCDNVELVALQLILFSSQFFANSMHYVRCQVLIRETLVEYVDDTLADIDAKDRSRVRDELFAYKAYEYKHS